MALCPKALAAWSLLTLSSISSSKKLQGCSQSPLLCHRNFLRAVSCVNSEAQSVYFPYLKDHCLLFPEVHFPNIVIVTVVGSGDGACMCVYICFRSEIYMASFFSILARKGGHIQKLI